MKPAAVAIGRNEGSRLAPCIRSLVAEAVPVVYVDSGSLDDSVAVARQAGALAIAIDPPFTAARGRNAGAEEVLCGNPEADAIQFLDGDCELVPGWIQRAGAELERRPDVAVVCGRRRERHPDRSVYNLLCDIEWDTPVGETASCGGDFLVRTAAWREVGGFNGALIAGEEPELCLRLRRKGWRILRLDAQMSLHDADITRFSQWWRRTRRAGYAFAEGAWMHGRGAERHYLRQSASIWFWAALLPATSLVTLSLAGALGLVPVALYPALLGRIYHRLRQRGYDPRASRLYALFCVAGKLPQLLGQLLFLARLVARRSPRIIEYKAGGNG